MEINIPYKRSHIIEIRQYFIRALIAVLFVCAVNAAALADSDKLKTILVGSELDYPPYALVTEDGEADGFSVELIKAVVEELGIDITFHMAPWNEIKTHLEQGEIDLLPHVYYSQERDKLFDFTVTHTSADAAIFARKGDQRNLTVDDLRQETVIVMKSDWTHEYLVTNDLIDKVVLVKTVPDALRLLSSGEYDVAFLPHLVGLLLIRDLKLTDIEISKDLVPVGRGFAFAVREGDFRLLQRLNEGLAIIKASGRYDEIYEKWFGVVDPKGVSRSTVILYAAWTGAGVVILTVLIIIWIVVLRRTVAQQTADLRKAHDNLEMRVIERAGELQESEARLANAQRIARLGNWNWDINTGALFWSDEIYRLFGHKPQSFKATYDTFLDAIHPDDRQAVLAALEKAEKKESPYDIDHRIVLPDGTVRHVREQGEMTFGKNEAPLTMSGTVYDITEQKKLEFSLKEANQLNETIFTASPIGFATFSYTGQCRSVNDAFTNIIGATREQALSQNFYEIETWKASGLFDKALECLSTNEQIKIEIHVVSTFGKDIHLDCYLIPIDVNEGKCLLLMIRDITEYKKMQAHLIQTSKLASLGEMSTNIAHELNQPLNIIRMSSDTLTEMMEDGENPSVDNLKIKLGRISSQIKRASDIIDRMRVFGRKSEEQSKKVSLREAVLGATEHLREQLRLSEIELELDIPETTRSVMGDIIQLEQVILNLMSNARDAIKNKDGVTAKTKGPDTVSIKVEDDPATGTIKVIIEDTGGGIPKDVLPRIFEPFFTTKEIGKGTGVGLSISYGIITDMKGTITAENADSGAKFTVTLPTVDEDADQD